MGDHSPYPRQPQQPVSECWDAHRSALCRTLTCHVIAILLLSAPLGTLAGHQLLTVLTANYPNAPATLEQARFAIVETYVTPSQLPLPDTEISRSRVQYLNRKGQTPRSYQLEGTIRCRNRTSKAIEGLQLTFVFLNLFHERLENTHVTVRESVPPRQTATIAWSQTLKARDADEVRLAITAVRFSDGEVWQAPNKDLIAWPE